MVMFFTHVKIICRIPVRESAIISNAADSWVHSRYEWLDTEDGSEPPNFVASKKNVRSTKPIIAHVNRP